MKAIWNKVMWTVWARELRVRVEEEVKVKVERKEESGKKTIWETKLCKYEQTWDCFTKKKVVESHGVDSR